MQIASDPAEFSGCGSTTFSSRSNPHLPCWIDGSLIPSVQHTMIPQILYGLTDLVGIGRIRESTSTGPPTFRATCRRRCRLAGWMSALMNRTQSRSEAAIKGRTN